LATFSRQDLEAADQMRADVRDRVAIAQMHAQPERARAVGEQPVVAEHGEARANVMLRERE